MTFVLSWSLFPVLSMNNTSIKYSCHSVLYITSNMPFIFLHYRFSSLHNCSDYSHPTICSALNRKVITVWMVVVIWVERVSFSYYLIPQDKSVWFLISIKYDVNSTVYCIGAFPTVHFKGLEWINTSLNMNWVPLRLCWFHTFLWGYLMCFDVI